MAAHVYMQEFEQQESRIGALQTELARLKADVSQKANELEDTSRLLAEAKRDLATNENRVSLHPHRRERHDRLSHEVRKMTHSLLDLLPHIWANLDRYGDLRLAPKLVL
jgi:septal ring factor EnvC (AmiA/AmiB activator)